MELFASSCFIVDESRLWGAWLTTLPVGVSRIWKDEVEALGDFPWLETMFRVLFRFLLVLVWCWNMNIPACIMWSHTHTHTHTRLTAFFGTTRVSRYQQGKTNLDFTEARDSEWQWHQLGRMQVSTVLQTDNHASTLPLSFYRPDTLPAAQPTVSKHWRQDLYNVIPLLKMFMFQTNWSSSMIEG